MISFSLIIKLILLVQFTQCNQLTVNTTYGVLRGREFTSRNGRIVAAFHGIPFAKPPLGELRFQDPQPPEPWVGVREAYNFGSVCVQIPFLFLPVGTTKLGNEDCLYLSVYSPNIKPKKLLPVLVYLNYGGFFLGSGEIDRSPEFFLDYDIVVVMPNYRLGVFGFLTMEDDIMPGNMGLKDQVMALVWVKINIANFGGDPNQVTLIGESAGGACVHYHMYSPMSKGLFHRGISQSGSALTNWVNSPPGIARSRAIKMGQIFNCSTESSVEILNCLRSKNAYELTESFQQFRMFQVDPVLVFLPIFDTNASNPFLPFNPHNVVPAPVPWIVSVGSLEGLARTGAFVQAPDSLTEFDQKFNQVAPISLFFDNTASNPKQVAKHLREFYFGDQSISMKLFRNLSIMYTDGLFIWPVVKALRKHRGPHYFYYFNYLGENSYQESFAGEIVLTGSANMDDALYVWRNENPFEMPAPTSSQDLYISNLLLKLFYNFISLGEPTPSGFDFDWPQWNDHEQNFLSIENSGVNINSTLFPERMQFWEQLNFRDKVDGN
ncbi:juvenile hormone esterase-like [Rhodnius prolixus]|uniref:juvenile hormone esterase-like n=1 Tax=Rhodnius prolixus TaxID=13249 RepID=UPI003D18EC43